MRHDDPDIGRIAFDAYAARSDNRSLVSGAELPSWDNMPRAIREAWTAAALAVADLFADPA